MEAEDRKGVEANKGKSGMGNPEAESIRRQAEQCVKLKTFTEIRQSSLVITFVTPFKHTTQPLLQHDANLGLVGDKSKWCQRLFSQTFVSRCLDTRRLPLNFFEQQDLST